MSLARMFGRGFIRKWQDPSNDEKCKDEDFLDMCKDLNSGSLSMYRGEASEDFATQIVAANSINRKSVQTVDVVILHAYPTCFIISETSGNTGIRHIDDAHVDTGRISVDELCEIFKNVSDDNMHTITESKINNMLKQWYYDDDNYKNKIINSFSENRINKILR